MRHRLWSGRVTPRVDQVFFMSSKSSSTSSRTRVSSLRSNMAERRPFGGLDDGTEVWGEGVGRVERGGGIEEKACFQNLQLPSLPEVVLVWVAELRGLEVAEELQGVRMRVFRSLLSLSSVTLICCLMISADVIGRLSRGPNLGLDLGLDPDPPGDNGFDPHELARLEDGDRRIIFSPNALFTRLVTAIPTPGAFTVPGPVASPSE
ncbi:double-stranded RNA-binding protein 4 [Striga asiatica]|uniref:Double-stranded RNA-binding protein 4 n=1 Tax=Striga asiatica TaxID=4170 RepID=A0A5A7QMB4_STRAF|nr:double-stranded RNA-binding protein 4 [Striga asiatica]